MRACMVAYAFYETDNRIRRYAETLAKRGDEVEAFVLGREGQPSYELIQGVHVTRIQKRVRDERGPISYLLKILTFFVRSTLILALRHLRKRFDIIHVHSVPDFEVFAAIIPRLLGALVILDIHDIVPEFYASKFKVTERSFIFRLLLLAEKLSAAFSDHVIISNHLWQTKLTERSVQVEKCTTILNYPDPSIFFPRPRTVSNDEGFVMCYPGSLNWHQGVDMAISATALLRDELPGLRFLIIGEGPDREKLRALVLEQRLEDRVTIAGLIPLEQVAQTMANIDLGIVPKRKDSFGNEAFSTKIMEFMAMGVPVVVSNTRIDRHYFPESAVQFFESENPEDLAVKIRSLVHDANKRIALRTNGMEYVRHNNWNIKKVEYLALVDNLVKHRPHYA